MFSKEFPSSEATRWHMRCSRNEAQQLQAEQAPQRLGMAGGTVTVLSKIAQKYLVAVIQYPDTKAWVLFGLFCCFFFPPLKGKEKILAACRTLYINRQDPAHNSPQGPPSTSLLPSVCRPGDVATTPWAGQATVIKAVTSYLLLCSPLQFMQILILHER